MLDIKFEPVKEPLLDKVVVNTSAAKEHVAEIKQCIRTMKEKCRCTMSTLPFEVLPKLVVINIVYHEVMWANAFPNKKGVSETFSPQALILRNNLDVTLHAKYDFCQYGKVADEPEPSNTMVERTQGALYVRSTGNIQGSMKFFLLKSARVVRRRQFTPLDMPTKVITRVNAIGRRTKQEVYGRNLEFLNRVKEKFEWSHEDDLDEMLGETPPEPADFPSISLATGEQVDSRAIQPDIQTEREFILASNDNQHSVFAEPRGDFDTLPNAITTGAELEDSLGDEHDEHFQ